MTLNINETLENIRKDYYTLQSHGPAVFGAKSHLYHLNDPLKIEAVEAFERKHNIELPEDYRRYLTEFAEGGAGPAYGVYRLEDSPDNP